MPLKTILSLAPIPITEAGTEVLIPVPISASAIPITAKTILAWVKTAGTAALM